MLTKIQSKLKGLAGNIAGMASSKTFNMTKTSLAKKCLESVDAAALAYALSVAETFGQKVCQQDLLIDLLSKELLTVNVFAYKTADRVYFIDATSSIEASSTRAIVEGAKRSAPAAQAPAAPARRGRKPKEAVETETEVEVEPVKTRKPRVAKVPVEEVDPATPVRKTRVAKTVAAVEEPVKTRKPRVAKAPVEEVAPATPVRKTRVAKAPVEEVVPATPVRKTRTKAVAVEAPAAKAGSVKKPVKAEASPVKAAAKTRAKKETVDAVDLKSFNDFEDFED